MMMPMSSFADFGEKRPPSGIDSCFRNVSTAISIRHLTAELSFERRPDRVGTPSPRCHRSAALIQSIISHQIVLDSAETRKRQGVRFQRSHQSCRALATSQTMKANDVKRTIGTLILASSLLSG